MTPDETTIVYLWPDPGNSPDHIERLVNAQRAMKAEAMQWTRTPAGWQGRFLRD